MSDGMNKAALAFSRVSRAVRLTVMLAERIEAQARQDARDAEARDEDEDADGEPLVGRGGRPAGEVVQRVKTRMLLLSRKDEVRQLVERAIDAGRDAGRAPEDGGEEAGEARAERLRAELGVRLESPETDEREWLERPLGEIARRVCADLGVGYDPRLWDGEAGAGAAVSGDAVSGAAPRAAGRRRWPYWLAEGPAYASTRLQGAAGRAERGPP